MGIRDSFGRIRHLSWNAMATEKRCPCGLPEPGTPRRRHEGHKSERIRPQNRLVNTWEPRQINSAAFHMWARRSKKINANGMVFAASIADINKALDKLNRKERAMDLKELIPQQYHDYLQVFDPKQANKLPPHRKGVDHEIKIEGE